MCVVYIREILEMIKLKVLIPAILMTGMLAIPQVLLALDAPKVTLAPKTDGSVSVGLSIAKKSDLRKLKGGLIQVQRSVNKSGFQALAELKKPKKKMTYRDIPGVEGTIKYRARSQAKKLRSKFSKVAAVALPYQTPVPKPTATPGAAPTSTPRPTATPTSVPVGGNNCSNGNTTGFGIPGGYTGHASAGTSLYLVNCTSCHNSSFIRNNNYSKIYASRNRGDMAGVRTLLSSVQNVADLTAKANCP